MAMMSKGFQIMDQSKYASNKETTNFARIARLILGPCTDVLRDVLKKEIRPSDLPKLVRTYLAKLPKQKKCPITKEQENLINKANYSDFDVTLLYFLLRNISNIPQHKNQWGNTPRPGDNSASANIEMIRLIRNEFGHSSDFSISENDFKNKWQEIFDIVRNLEGYVGSATNCQNAVNSIKICSMDPDQSTKYTKKLIDLNKKINDISGEVENIQKTIIPWNVKVQNDKEVSIWKEEDVLFVESHNFESMLDQVKEKPYVTFVGVPGSGKTATTRHIALILQKDGYEILPITHKSEIKELCDPNCPQVFVIDDVLGVFGFDITEFHMLIKYEKCLSQPIKKESKFLMTCRETIFRNESLLGSFLSEEKNIVKLHSDENSLTFKDKYDLLVKYKLDTNLISQDSNSLTSKMFPFLCKLSKNYGSNDFFISPVPFILKLLDGMKIRNKIQYASLVLLMTSQNKCPDYRSSQEIAKEQCEDIKNEVLEKCKANSRTDYHEITDALREMVGTYTELCNSQFSFIHDSMFEITAYHFGCQFPEMILKYMSSDYIANYITLETHEIKKRKPGNRKEISNNEDSDVDNNCLRIILKESYYRHLATRLLKDIENGELYNVFGNPSLKHSKFCHAFLDELKEKEYPYLYSVFLAELTYKFKINGNQNDKYNLNEGEHYQFLSVLFDERTIPNHDGIWNSVKAISWVIYCRHNQVLRYIIDQIILMTGNANALFQTSYQKDCQGRKKTENNASYTTLDLAGYQNMTESSNDSNNGIDYIQNTGARLIEEQWRLLCLGCYSGDLNTVQTLLQHVSKDAVNNTKPNEDKVFKDIKPLVIVCSFGYLDIAQELVRAGADVNQKAKFETPLTAACEKGHLSIVKELIKSEANLNLEDGNQTPLITACKEGHLRIVQTLLKAGADINLRSHFDTPLTAAYKNNHLQIFKELLNAGADFNIQYGGKKILTAVCEKGNLNIVQYLIDAGADINLIHNKETPLTSACKHGHLDIVKALIKAGADVDLKDGFYTPITAAYENDHFLIFEELLNADADVNIQYKKKPLLTDACEKGNLNNVREFIKLGANVNQKDEKYTPLTIACLKGHLNIVRELIKARADVNIFDSCRAPIVIACRKKKFNIFEELVSAGADVDINYKQTTLLIVECQEGNLPTVRKLIKAGADVNRKEKYHTPLIIASKEGHCNIVHELIKAGADVNQNTSYYTPLTAAIGIGHLNVMVELIRAGADVNLNCQNNYVTPLILACQKGHLNIVKTLIEAKANVNLGTTWETPLRAAFNSNHLNVVKELIFVGLDNNIKYGTKTFLTFVCEEGYLGIVKALIKAGTNVNKRDNNNTPLTVACRKGHLETVKELIRAGGADVNQIDKYQTPLTTACRQGHVPIVKLLIREGADVNLKDENQTPLTIACENGYLSIVQNLLKAEAHVNLKDNYHTPLTIACLKSHLHIVEELIQSGADVNLDDGYRTPLTLACQKRPFSKEFLNTTYNQSDVDKTHHINNYFEGNLRFFEDSSSPGDSVSLNNEKEHLKIVKELVKAGADVNLKDSFGSPISNAIDHTHLCIAKELIEFGAEVKSDPIYHKLLIYACQSGNIIAVKRMIAYGADVNLSISMLETISSTNDEINLRSKENQIQKRENTNRVNVCEYQEILAKKAHDYVNMKNECKTPLTVACQGGHLDIVRELIIAGADVNLQDALHTPLTVACREGHMSIVEELVKADADVNLRDAFNTPLAISCANGHLCIAEVLRKAGAEVILKNVNPNLMKLACQKGYIAFLDQLIQMGVDVNESFDCVSQSNCSSEEKVLYDYAYSITKGSDIVWDDSNVDPLCKSKDELLGNVRENGCNKPLTTACQNGHLGIAKELIKAGADVNIRDGNYTPLTISCKEGHLCIVEELIRAGADVNLKDFFNTPMTVACKMGHFVIAEILRKSGAKFTHPNLLPLACYKGYLFIVEELIKAGADVNLSSSLEEKDEQIYVEHTTDNGEFHYEQLDENIYKKSEIINIVNKKKCRKPITGACQRGHLNIVQELIKSGANVDITDGHRTPLTTACTQGHLGIVKELIGAGADVNLQNTYLTPLTTACQLGHSNIVEELIKAGADINQKDIFHTPLTAACEYQNLNIAEVLLKAGAAINSEDRNSNLLSFACLKGYFRNVKELIKIGANVNQTYMFIESNLKEDAKHIKNKTSVCFDDPCVKRFFDEGFRTETEKEMIIKYNFSNPLVVACQEGHLNIVKELIKARADINFQDGYRTPLTIACQLGHLSIVEELIKAGADLNLKDTFHTPLTAAGENGHCCIAKMLIKAGANPITVEGRKGFFVSVAELN